MDRGHPQARRGPLMDLLVNIDVDDLAKGIAFYEKALGVRVGRRFAFGVELLGASSAIYLLVKNEGTQPTPMSADLRRYRRHWTPVHLDVVVDDVGAAVGRALGSRRDARRRHPRARLGADRDHGRSVRPRHLFRAVPQPRLRRDRAIRKPAALVLDYSAGSGLRTPPVRPIRQALAWCRAASGRCRDRGRGSSRPDRRSAA